MLLRYMMHVIKNVPGNMCDACVEYTKNGTTAALNIDLLEVEGTLQKMPLLLLLKHIIIQKGTNYADDNTRLLCLNIICCCRQHMVRCCYYRLAMTDY